jgi:hypothetical protein
MSQHYPDINSPHFGQKACSTIVELVLEHLPLGIKGRYLLRYPLKDALF